MEDPTWEEWYDSSKVMRAESADVLFIILYCTLIVGAAGAAGLVVSATPPEFVETVLKISLVASLVIGGIGFAGAFGVPPPWPFVPHWVVDFLKANSARRREHRQARKWKRKYSLGNFPSVRSPLKNFHHQTVVPSPL